MYLEGLLPLGPKKTKNSLREQRARVEGVNRALIKDLSNKTGLDEDKFFALLAAMKLNINTQRTQRVLIMLRLHRPEVVAAAYYSYASKRRDVNTTQEQKVSQFKRFLNNHAVTTPNLSDLDKQPVSDNEYKDECREFTEDLSYWSKND